MGYIGKFPTAIPITSSDLADGIITTSKLANDSVNASKFDETDNYSFTGTVSGAGDVSNLVKLSSFQIANNVSAYANNSIFTSDYKKYLVTFNNVGISTNSGHFRFKFFNDTGATSDNKMSCSQIGIKADNVNMQQTNHNSYPYLGVNMYNGTSQGVNGFLWVQDPLNTNIQTGFQFQTSYTHTSGYTAHWTGGGNTNDSGRYHTGFYWYTESGGNFQGDCRITVFGVKH